MRIAMIPINGRITRALVVYKTTPSTPCENCGKPMYNHRLLAKTNKDWCMNCDDKEHRGDMTDTELGAWTLLKMNAGLAVIVVSQDKPLGLNNFDF